jgi:hypothetical protein
MYLGEDYTCNFLQRLINGILGEWPYDQKVESDNYPIAGRNLPLTVLLK